MPEYYNTGTTTIMLSNQAVVPGAPFPDGLAGDQMEFLQRIGALGMTPPVPTVDLPVPVSTDDSAEPGRRTRKKE